MRFIKIRLFCLQKENLARRIKRRMTKKIAPQTQDEFLNNLLKSFNFMVLYVFRFYF